MTPGPRMLYLGENHQVAIYEVGALLGDPNQPVANPRGSWVLMSLRVRLHRVAELSESAEQKLIGTTNQELTGGWSNAAGSAPTQKLGAALFTVPGLEGFTFPSAKSGSLNLAVFMDKLAGGSSITFDNEISGKKESLI